MAAKAYRQFTNLVITHNQNKTPIGYVVVPSNSDLISQLGTLFIIGANSSHKVGSNYMSVTIETLNLTLFEIYVYTTASSPSSFTNTLIAPIFESDLPST